MLEFHLAIFRSLETKKGAITFTAIVLSEQIFLVGLNWIDLMVLVNLVTLHEHSLLGLEILNTEIRCQYIFG